MNILPFDESLAQRKILPYRSVYGALFESVRAYVDEVLPGITLIHIGSTAISDLRGKPMIDTFAVSDTKNLRTVQNEFERIGFHKRDVWTDRDDKPYVCGSIEHAGERFNVNIHICNRGNPALLEALSFMRQLAKSPSARRTYEKAKQKAHDAEPDNPELYNKAKETVILEIQSDRPKSAT